MSTKTKPRKLVPFYADGGDMAEWASEGDPRFSWQEPAEFEALLWLDDLWRGRSSVMFRLHKIGGPHYIMRASEFFKMCKATTVASGRVEGVFAFKKQGQNWSITFVRDVYRGGGWV